MGKQTAARFTRATRRTGEDENENDDENEDECDWGASREGELGATHR